MIYHIIYDKISSGKTELFLKDFRTTKKENSVTRRNQIKYKQHANCVTRHHVIGHFVVGLQ